MSTIQVYNRNLILTSLFLFSYIFNAQCQSTLYVNLNATGANDGSSWNDAFLELQDAIDNANTGDAIWVAAGTYYPTVAFDADNSGSTTTREQTFYINKNIQLYGQFNGSETMLSQRHKANLTILSGDLGTLQDATDNAFHVVYVDGTTSNGMITNNTILDGFVVEDGAATGVIFPNNVGGGILINGRGIGSQCNPTLTNLVLEHNMADENGGALYNDGSQNGTCDLTLNKLYFYANTAQNGGAIYNNGEAGQVNLLLNENHFRSNTATQGGGVMYNLMTNNGQINNSTASSVFLDNSASEGAVYYNNGTANSNLLMNIDNSIFKENESTTKGGVFYNECSGSGGIFDIRINNNEFNTNGSNDIGGIFHTDASQHASVIISSILNEFNDNFATSSGGIFHSTVEYSATLDITFEDNEVENTNVNGNGGVFCTNGNFNANIFMEVIKNNFENNVATNGGILYHTVNNTNLNINLEQNGFFGSLVANGGISFVDARLNSTVSIGSLRNTYVFNSASNKGGVFSHTYDASMGYMALVNDIVHVNSSDNEGVIYNKGVASSLLFTKIINCTFNENMASSGGARSISNIATSSTSTTEISNSIFSHIGGTTPEIKNTGGQMTLSYSLYKDNNNDGLVVLPIGVTGNNNIDGEPLYNNEIVGDLTMKDNSPTIDAGSNDSLPSLFTEDNVGQMRIYNTSVDMGALEYNNNLVVSVPSMNNVSCNGQTDGFIGIKILGATPTLMINGVASLDPTHYDISGLAAGTYQYTFLDSVGRTDSVSITIAEPSPIILSTTSLSTGIASVTASGGRAPYTYLWNDANAQSTDVARGLSNGTYSVTVTDANGCTEVAAITMNLMTSQQVVASNSTSEISIVPNPSSGQVQISFSLEEKTRVQPFLYNLQGQMVHEFKTKEGQKIHYTENLSQLPSGTYMLRTTIKNEHITQPLVLIK